MSAIADTAESYIGTIAEDCSKFVQNCYAAHGIKIPRSSGQIYNQGNPSNGSRGDIVCWNGHVGICDGNGNVIHAYNSDYKVSKDSISQVSDWDHRSVIGYVNY